MAKHQVTLTYLELVTVTPPEKRMVSENDNDSSRVHPMRSILMRSTPT